jgi:hypothetical protein
VVFDCDLCGCFPSSLAHQSTPEQSARSLIYGRRFNVNRPMDLNALLFCVWMMSEGCSCQSSTSVACPWLIVVLCLDADIRPDNLLIDGESLSFSLSVFLIIGILAMENVFKFPVCILIFGILAMEKRF